MDDRQHKGLYYFLTVYGLTFIACAIVPYDRGVWWAENIPILLLVTGIVWVYQYHRFSNFSFICMGFLVVLHTIGGHFTFERVPFDWFTTWLGFERNHYDRIAHFSVGLYAFAIAEILLKKKLVSASWVLLLFPLFTIMAVAAAYEVFEWL